MKIIDKTAGESVLFSSLSNGQVFKNEFGIVYLKITSSTVRDDDGFRCNAFNLEDRYLVFFSRDKKVQPVETILTITSFKKT